MFDVKKKEFYKNSNEDGVVVSDKTNITYSGNGSLKLKSSGNLFVDDFASIAYYRKPREISEVFDTMNSLWEVDPITTLKESVYLRIISRETEVIDKLNTKYKVTGQGLKSEFHNRLMWLAVYHPDTFYKNLGIFISAGSWEDLFALMRIDLSYEHDGDKYKRVLDWKSICDFIASYLKDEKQASLVKKYLPTIKAAKYCTTLKSQYNNYIGKYIAKYLYGSKNKVLSYRKYHSLKRSGTAHEWQQLISQGRFNELDFNKISGRALTKLVDSQFLVNHNLEKEFTEWILSSDRAKFTGFVYELFNGISRSTPEYKKELINKQFMSLVDKAKENKNTERLMCCIDTSYSMESVCVGLSNTTAETVAVSMALYFSYLNTKFSNGTLEFASTVTFTEWKGETPFDKFVNFNGYCMGSTNFLGVADWLVSTKQSLNLDESVFPTGILCISDGEFNRSKSQTTTFKTFRNKLSEAFSKEYVDNFKLILWDIPNNFYGPKKAATFESSATDPGFFYMSGFDPEGIKFLLGKAPNSSTPKTAEELFKAAMDQELLNLLRI